VVLREHLEGLKQYARAATARAEALRARAERARTQAQQLRAVPIQRPGPVDVISPVLLRHLQRRFPSAFCVDCLAKTLAIHQVTVDSALAALQEQGGKVQRGVGVCCPCRLVRDGVAAALDDGGF
jgi:hypothetical protein